MKKTTYLLALSTLLVLIGCGSSSSKSSGDSNSSNSSIIPSGGDSSNMPNSNSNIPSGGNSNMPSSNANIPNGSGNQQVEQNSSSTTQQSTNITYTENDTEAIRTALAGRTFYFATRGTNYVGVMTFNDDVTVMNEGTQDATDITLVENKILYDDNQGIDNYTLVTGKTDKYIQTYAVYAGGIARDDMRLYYSRADAQAYLGL